METWEVNLCDTKNHMLVEDIDEALALHYLSSHGFFLVARPIKFRLHGEIVLIATHYQKQGEAYRQYLTDTQKEYLINFPSWDYVAFRKECEPYPYFHGKIYFMKIWKNPYLVEVKTVRGERSPYKKPRRYFVSVEKDLGFKPIFVIVRLLENWNVLVQANEL